MKKRKGEGDNKVKYGTISLPMPLIDSMKKKIKGTGINSVSSYVSFILRQILSSPSNSKQPFTEQEERDTKARLKKLGYI